MKSIRIINRLIMSKIIEIIFIITFLVLSHSLYKKNSQLLSALNISNNFHFTNLFIENDFNNIMVPLSKTNALKNLKPTKLIVKNDTLTKEEYVLMLKYSKKIDIDYNYLNIAINDKIVPLNTLKKAEDNKNNYFILEENQIMGEEKEYLIRLWLDEKVENNIYKKRLNVEFELVKGTANI